MEQAAAQRRDGRQDGLPGELVAEGQPVVVRTQQATGNALVDFVKDRTGNGQQEGGVDRRAHDGRDVEDRAGLG